VNVHEKSDGKTNGNRVSTSCRTLTILPFRYELVVRARSFLFVYYTSHTVIVVQYSNRFAACPEGARQMSFETVLCTLEEKQRGTYVSSAKRFRTEQSRSTTDGADRRGFRRGNKTDVPAAYDKTDVVGTPPASVWIRTTDLSVRARERRGKRVVVRSLIVEAGTPKRVWRGRLATEFRKILWPDGGLPTDRIARGDRISGSGFQGNASVFFPRPFDDVRRTTSNINDLSYYHRQGRSD